MLYDSQGEQHSETQGWRKYVVRNRDLAYMHNVVGSNLASKATLMETSRSGT